MIAENSKKGGIAMKRVELLVSTLLLCVLFVGSAAFAEELTGEEILARAKFGGELKSEGSLIITFRSESKTTDGTTTADSFVGFSKRTEEGTEFLLLYFLDVGYNSGSILLMETPEQETTRQWYYSPEWDLLRELDVETQGQSFGGSTFSFQDLGGYDLEGYYTAEVIGNERLVVGEAERMAYVLPLSAKPQEELDFPTAKMWIDKETFFVLRVQKINPGEEVEQTVYEVLALGEFDGAATVDHWLEYAGNGSPRTIIILERRRPEDEFLDEVFDSENLVLFDPAEYGF